MYRKLMNRLSFIQLSAFRTNWNRLKLNDDDLRALESEILSAPEEPPVMRGTGGLRKIRFARASSNTRKSGGMRVCYAYFPRFGLIYLCAIFAKSTKANLTPAEAAAYNVVLKEFSRYLNLNFKTKGLTP
jgi:hypothetical protein